MRAFSFFSVSKLSDLPSVEEGDREKLAVQIATTS